MKEVFKIKKIRIDDMIKATYDANLDTEYREAICESLMDLKYISDSPLVQLNREKK